MVQEMEEDEGRSRLMLIIDILKLTVYARQLYSLFKSSEPPWEAGAVIIRSIIQEETEALSLCNCIKVTRPGNAEPG